MYVRESFEGGDPLIPMGKPEFETSPNMKAVGLMLQLTGAIWITRKAVIRDSGLCVIKRLFGN